MNAATPDGWGKCTAGAFVRDVGDQVKLRLDFMIDGTPVLSRRGKTIAAVVLPRDAPPVPGRLLSWHWSPRKRRA